jgi:hypothetical protein
VHYPRSVGELEAWFRTDADCLNYLEWLCSLARFVCPDYHHVGGWASRARSAKRQVVATVGVEMWVATAEQKAISAALVSSMIGTMSS